MAISDKTIVTNTGKVTGRAIPSTGTPIKLYCTSQSMPGFQDANTWNYANNDPDQEIGLTEAGRIPGMNALEFKMAYTPSLHAEMTVHKAKGTKFDIELTYDHEAYTEIVVITVHDCFILNPGSSETTEIEGVSYMSVKFQPRGGGKFADVMTITATPRP